MRENTKVITELVGLAEDLERILIKMSVGFDQLQDAGYEMPDTDRIIAMSLDESASAVYDLVNDLEGVENEVLTDSATLYRIQATDVDSFLEDKGLSTSERLAIHERVQQSFGDLGIMDLLGEFVGDAVDNLK